MYGFSRLLTIVVLLFLIVALGRLFTAPLELAWKLLVNAAVGLFMLWVVNLLAPITGISLQMNLFNALIAGIFGLPGLVLLILFKLVL